MSASRFRPAARAKNTATANEGTAANNPRAEERTQSVKPSATWRRPDGNQTRGPQGDAATTGDDGSRRKDAPTSLGARRRSSDQARKTEPSISTMLPMASHRQRNPDADEL
jgi:hypothetical protein